MITKQKWKYSSKTKTEKENPQNTHTKKKKQEMNGIELYIYNIFRGYECEFVENCLNVFNERHNKKKQKTIL